MRKQIAAANWKMNLTIQQGEQLLDAIIAKPHELSAHQQAVFAVPFPYLAMAQQKIAGKKNVFIAAQNCYSKKSGAYTGETSVEMLQSLGISIVVGINPGDTSTELFNDTVSASDVVCEHCTGQTIW